MPHCAETSELPERAGEILSGRPLEGLDTEKRALLLDAWLRWAQQDTPEVRKDWAFLAAKKGSSVADRDRFVLDLWGRMIEGRGEEGSVVSYLEAHHFPWSFYERHFSGWFRGRFHLRASRALFPEARLAASLHVIFALLLAAAGTVALAMLGPTLRAAGLATFGAVVVAFVLFLLSRLPGHAFLDSLIPRLGATVGIGYLFLAAAPDLVRVIYEVRWATGRLWGVALALLVGVFLYVCLHVRQRVFPPLPAREVLGRAASLTILAVGYAVAGLAVASPLLFRAGLLFGPNTRALPAGPPRPAHLALCAAIALALGVVLQLAWEEKPLTEPL